MNLHTSMVALRRSTGDALPCEILSDIFVMALPSVDEMRDDVYNLPNGIKHASISVPMAISHVCRHWRQVSLFHGPLWSYLCIAYDDFDGPDYCSRVLEIFDIWLDRVDKSPLNFLLHFTLRHYTEDRSAFEKRVTALTSRQRQWRDVDFDWTCQGFSSEFCGIHIDNMPLLSSLELVLRLDGCNESAFHARVDIANSLALRHFCLCGTYSLVTDDDTHTNTISHSTTGKSPFCIYYKF